MIKLRHTFLLALVLVICYGCPSDTEPPFDHTAQAIIDKDSISEFLKSNYYDADLDSIKPLINGKTALINDSKLKKEEIKYEDIDYTLYYYQNRVGSPDPVEGFPSSMDSVFVKYRGQYIARKDSLSPSFDRSDRTWLILSGLIPGWYYGLQNFKGGKNITNNGPITFENFGKGILIFPSGLAYKNIEQPGIPPSSNLVFYIELYDIVEDTDLDQDGIPSILEIENASIQSNPRLVDTDGDGILNFADADDDNDGVLTKDEDANGDGDPRNDFSDPNNPTLPDYLNPKIKG